MENASEIIKTFNGKEGISRLLDDVFETLKYSGGEVYISGIDERRFIETDKEIIKEHVERLAYHGISERMLARDGDSFFLGPASQYRWVPEHQFSPTPFYVYADKVAMIVWGPDPSHTSPYQGEENKFPLLTKEGLGEVSGIAGERSPLVIIIKNLALADAYRKQFLFMWERAKLPPSREATVDERSRLEQAIIKRYGNRITPITDGDRKVFREMLHRHVGAGFTSAPQGQEQALPLQERTVYANSWYYLTQAANGAGKEKLGLKYWDGEMLATIGIFNRASLSGGWHFHIIRPMGGFDIGKLVALSRSMLEISGTPVYIKKVTKEQQGKLLEAGFSPIESYPWHAQAIEEDDTYPEQIIDINETLNAVEASGKRDLKDKYQRFMARFGNTVRVEELTSQNSHVAQGLVKKFFEYLDMRELHISAPSDYDNIIFYPPLGKNGETYFAQVLYIADQPAAFFAIEPISPDTAGLYANITLHQEFPYLSEYLIVYCCRLLKEKGYRYLNLGGSETAGLFQFKEKFSPVAYNKMHWVVYKY